MVYINIHMPESIFLFGHRKQHGKDTCCDILEEEFQKKKINYCRTYFAKHLKLMASKLYNLDFEKMESKDYKNSKPAHLNGKSVRDVLLHLGQKEREKDPDVWVRHSINEILKSNTKVGMISDFRYPNEFDSIEKLCHEYFESKVSYASFNYKFSYVMPFVHKILVHRVNGQFVEDGADDQLPDVDEKYWDYIIINDDESNNWRNSLKNKLMEYVRKNV